MVSYVPGVRPDNFIVPLLFPQWVGLVVVAVGVGKTGATRVTGIDVLQPVPVVNTVIL
jgi:hypothetical protein